jgi:hypothetical protein
MFGAAERAREAAMKLTVGEAITADPALEPRVRAANQLLEGMGPTAKLATADWTLVSNADGRRQVVLTLADDTGARIETRFSPEDLANESRLQGKLYRS